MAMTYTKVGFDFTKQIEAQTKASIRRGMMRAAADMETEVKSLIGKQGPPRSKPGMPPRKETGNLQRSIKVRVIGNTMGFLWGEVADYAPHLEFGTVNMAPRPFIQPVFSGRGQRQKWTARVQQYVNEEMNRGTSPRRAAAKGRR